MFWFDIFSSKSENLGKNLLFSVLIGSAVLQNNCKTWLGESKTIDASQTHSLLHEHGISYIDILIVDHYAIDYVWEMSFSEIASKIMPKYVPKSMQNGLQDGSRTMKKMIPKSLK